MQNGLTDQELNREFTKYLQVRLFGLVAFIDRPNQDEHFPMASGAIVEVEGFFVLLTVAHYLEDVKRWKEEGRLNALFLLVHHESGICNPIPLNLEQNPSSFCDKIDVGFVMLSSEVVSEVNKRGGFATRRDTLSMSPEVMNSFYLVGHASAYCKVVRETISTIREGSKSIAWELTSPGDVAVVISKLRFDGKGTDPGTLRFALIKGFDDYRGASGGPIFAYRTGSLIRDYSLFAIQSRQVRSPTRDQKPTHVIGTSAAVAIHLIDEHIRKIANPVAGYMDRIIQ